MASYIKGLRRKGFKTPTKKSSQAETSNQSSRGECSGQRVHSKTKSSPTFSYSTDPKKAPRTLTSTPEKDSPAGTAKYSPHFSRTKRKQLFRDLLGADSKSGKTDLMPADEESGRKNTIETFFSRVKPPKLVPCPICQDQVALSAINRHLDNGCLSLGAKDDGDGFAQKSPKSSGSSNSSKERKIAEVRSDLKDRRTRLRLRKKMESHPLYVSDRPKTDAAQSPRPTESVCVPSPPIPPSSLSCLPSQKPVRSEYFSVEQNSKHHSKIMKPYLKHKLPSTSSSNTLGRTGSSLTEEDSSLMRLTPDEGNPNHLERKLSNVSECSTVILSQQSQEIPEAQEDVFVLYGNSSVSLPSQEAPSDCLYDTSPEYSKLSISKSGYLKYNDQTPRLTYRSIASDSEDPVLDSTDTSPSSLTPVPNSLMPTSHTSGADSTSGIGSQTCEKSFLPDSAEVTPSLSEDSRHGCLAPVTDNKEASLSSNKFYPDDGDDSNLKDLLDPLADTTSRTQTSITTSSSSFSRSNSTRGPALAATTPPRKASSSRSGSSTPLKRAAEASSPAGSPWKYRDPYFLVNFKLILNTVLANEDDRSLFNEEDMDVIDAFRNLSAPSQQLYVRLFQRKHAWLQVSKLDYKRIAHDLRPTVAELHEAGLVQIEKDLDDFEVALNLCSAPDLKTLAKTLRLAPSVGQTKPDLVSAVLKHGRQQRSLFAVSMEQLLIKKAKKTLGSCVRLNKQPRIIFSRLLLLFSLTTDMDDEDKASGGMSQLQTLLLSNMGRVIYPTYTVMRTVKIFATRDDLLRYETALHYETDIATAMSTNDFGLAYQLQQKAMGVFGEIQQDCTILGHDLTLPDFLRRYTAAWTYTRVAYTGVEILQKQRRYGEAVDALRGLLAQTNYCCDSRGRWWDRLALNLDQHLKKPEEALNAVQEGLADSYVRTGHRLALQLRAQKLLKSAGNKRLRKRLEEFTFDPVREMPRVTIRGQVLPYQAPGIKNTFVREWTGGQKREGDMAICRVEEVALEHYRAVGYPEGVHGEGSTFTTLICLLFWDVIFMEGIPDVFCYPYQSGPLDMRSDSFYRSRREALERRLGEIRQAGGQELQERLETSWTEYQGEQCIGVSWELFRDVQHAKGLLVCLGGEFLSAVAERIMRNHRHCRGGMPDLTVWNPDTGKFKLSEVKGPGDRLSQKQILWIDFFLSLGVDAEVCHVTAIGSKRLKLSRALGRDSDAASSPSQN